MQVIHAAIFFFINYFWKREKKTKVRTQAV